MKEYRTIEEVSGPLMLVKQVDGVKYDELGEIERTQKDGVKFINLVKRYNSFDEITPFMVNEFVDKILVHERDRKGSIQTTQTIDIYFNFRRGALRKSGKRSMNPDVRQGWKP